ncbi:MAG: hypothetical protein KKB37_12230 [Alphaproteobacteria bacterium]|nr:hypothetical protein [Alphaproteobacteria bacterium]
MHFGSWAVLVAARVFERLPASVVSAIGAGLGHLYALQADVRGQLWINRVRRNVALLGREKDPRRVDRLVYAAMRNSGRVTAEMTVLEKLEKHIAMHGIERLEALGKPVVLVFSHLGNWEFASLPFLATGQALVAIYAPPQNEAAHRIAVAARLASMRKRAPGSKLLPASPRAARELVRAAQAGENLLIAIDEERDGLVWNPPFGRKVPYAGNRMLVARIARKFDYAIVPVSVRRRRGIAFDLTVHPQIEVVQSGDVDADIRATADRISEFFEALIRDNIDQWYWLGELRMDRPFPK